MSERLIQADEVPENGVRLALVSDGREVALFKVNGVIFALDNFCPHAGGPLNEGKVENGTITCPWHAWTFDIPTGKCINMISQDAPTIPVRIEEGWVIID